MRAIVIQSPWNAAATGREIPRPKEREALLKMICGDIRGSDLASYRGMSAYVSYPGTIGHRFAAEVVEVGDNVYGIKSDMTAAGNPYSNCGTYYSYRRGMVNCCIRSETMGVQREDAFSDYLTIPAGRLYNGQNIDPRELALIEPFRISRHGVLWASVKPGDRVLVFGAGTTGILADVAAKSFGVRMYIMDIAGEKVEAAVRDFHLDGSFVDESRERLDVFVQKITDGDEFDATVETVGAPSVFLGCVQTTASRERAVVIGMAEYNADSNFLELQRKGLDIHGPRAVTAADFAATIKLVKNGLVDPKKLISKTYPVRSAAEMFRGLNQDYGEIIKAGFEFQGQNVVGGVAL